MKTLKLAKVEISQVEKQQTKHLYAWSAVFLIGYTKENQQREPTALNRHHTHIPRHDRDLILSNHLW